MEREFRQSTNALTLLAGVSDMSPYLAPHDGATPMLVQQLAAARRPRCWPTGRTSWPPSIA